jgi:hypothetical protein
MLRNIQESDLVGKTIKSVDVSAVNLLKLTFIDDTTAELWAMDAITTNFGSVPGIYIETP